MKPSLYIMALGVLLCVICLLRLLQLGTGSVPVEASQVIDAEEKRESITFILGEDRETDNPFYREATLFYSSHPDANTDYLVASCRSLGEVHQYLKQYPPCNGRPWEIVNLVSHGNPWSGLSVRISPGVAGRSTTDRINEAVDARVFEPYNDSVVDCETEIFLHGCGLGRSPELLQSVARAFRSTAGMPVVRASVLFENYSREQGALYPERYLADAYFVSYPMGRVPEKYELMNSFRDKYATAAIEWHTALQHESPRHVGDAYHYTMEVPVKVIVRDHDEAGDEAWINTHPEVVAAVQRTGLTPEDFAWTVRDAWVNNDDGTRTKAVYVRGYATLVIVLKALTTEGTAGIPRPLRPDPADLRYYAFAG